MHIVTAILKKCVKKDIEPGKSWCLTGNTKIPLLDGQTLTIKEIVEEFKDKSFRVYSCQTDGQIVSSLAHSARLTRKDAKIIRIYLDNNEYLECTPDHLIMLGDGTYKEAQYLEPSENLMPYFNLLTEEGCNLQGTEDQRLGLDKFHNCKVVKEVKKLTQTQDVYNFEVETYENFATAVGIFVHNCIYKHDPKDHSKTLRPQPKGWPKHYPTKERAKRGLKMMKTFSKGSFSILCAALKEKDQYDLIKRIEKKI